MFNLPEIVTTTQLANYFRVCKLTVRRWVRDGLLTPIGRDEKRAMLFRRKDVERLIRDLNVFYQKEFNQFLKEI